MMSAVFTPDIYVLAVDSTFFVQLERRVVSNGHITRHCRSEAQLLYKGAWSVWN
jgi:hypothetical protein